MVPFAVGTGVVLSWPFSALRRRSRRAGRALSPWAWGVGLGHGLCDLFTRRRRLEITGSLPELSPPSGVATRCPTRGMLLLGAHLGPWEAGAAELASRGYRPMVLAAPWERLPGAAQALAARRAQLGVLTATRGRAGWRAATQHLRAGGTVVALVDNLSPRRRGRRPLPFIEGEIGAPDALLAWARRQGAHVYVAVGHPTGFTIESLSGADHCVRRLKEAVEQHPASWAWVRALAVFALMFPVLSLSGCGGSDPLPPLPRDPGAWRASAEEVVWVGGLGEALKGRFAAARGKGRWRDGSPVGHFADVQVDLWSSETGLKLAEVTAQTAQGDWPAGPASFEEVHWVLPVAGQEGRLDTASWSGESGWGCGGCPLELLKP